MRDEVVAVVAVAGEPTAVTAAGGAARVEVVAAGEAAEAPVVPAVVATAVVADLLDAVVDATGGVTFREEYTATESNLIAECARSSGFGHEESIC